MVTALGKDEVRCPVCVCGGGADGSSESLGYNKSWGWSSDGPSGGQLKGGKLPP